MNSDYKNRLKTFTYLMSDQIIINGIDYLDDKLNRTELEEVQERTEGF